MIYGFIGTGVISEAIITGMMRSTLPVTKVIVSPRNPEVAKALAAQFPKVEIAADNQAVADGTGILILAVRPQMAEEVIRELVIPPGTKIISLIAGTSHDRLSAWTGHPAAEIVRAVPLPFVAYGEGVTAVFPSDPATEKLFDALGKAVVCHDQNEFDLLAVATALMGTYFGVMERTSAWLVGKGLPEATARNFLAPLFGSLAKVAQSSPETGFDALRQGFSTKGGLNEQVFSDFEIHGGSLALTKALDRVLERARQ